MENFNAKNYRDDLAKDLKEIRKSDPEKAKGILNATKETTEYKNAESKVRRLRLWEKEAQRRFEDTKELIEQVNSQTPNFMVPSENEGLEKLELLYEKYSEIIRERGKGPEQNGLSIGTFSQNDIFDNKYFNRDYGTKYGSDYPGEFSWGQKHHYERKLIYEKLGLLSESENSKRVEHLKNILTSDISKPHEAFRIIETLSLAGISGGLLDKLKNAVLESANANVVRKILEEFPISFSQKELHTVIQSALNKESLFDVMKFIEMAGEENISKELIEKRNSLLENAKEKFVENLKILKEGCKNDDFLVHFSGIPNTESIIKNGILSNLDQKKLFNHPQFGAGEGNDLQRICGRMDGISVLDAFKGSTRREKDSQLFLKMREEIEDSVNQFLKEKYNYNPANLFDFENPSRYTKEKFDIDRINENDLDKLRKKYSKILSISDGFEHRIDPTEKNADGGYHEFILRRSWGEININYVSDIKAKHFKIDFFEDVTEDKQDLISFIKKIMKDAYLQSNQNEEDRKEHIKSFEYSCKGWLQEGRNSSSFVLHPSLNRTFVQSIYQGESLVEGSILPEKILGAFINNAHLERLCYNEGKVALCYKEKGELVSENHEDVLLELPNGAIVVKNLYK